MEVEIRNLIEGKNITKDDLIRAMERIDREGPGKFPASVRYDVVYNGTLYPPKQVVAYAAEFHLGRQVETKELGEGVVKSPLFTLLLDEGFTVNEKIPEGNLPQIEVDIHSLEECVITSLQASLKPLKKADFEEEIRKKFRFSEDSYIVENEPRGARWTIAFGEVLSDISAKWNLHFEKKAFSFHKPRAGEPDEQPSAPNEEMLGEMTFLDRDECTQIIRLIQRKKNVILQGAPGTGKTYIARALAKSITGDSFDDNYHIVQFHQTYAYEDFVEGYRPDGDGGFKLRSGVFKRICEEARKQQDPVILVLDEINRGNLSKIFGELLVLLEADKRGPDHGVTLSYSGDLQDRFSIPKNLYVIGTMNTADRSLALVDYALRRRFGFFQAEPKFGSRKFKAHLQHLNVPEKVIDRIVSVMTSLNKAISSSKTLGPGFCIGHSFFCASETVDQPKEWYRDILKNEIEPLINEYCGLSGNLKDDLMRILQSDVH